MSETQKQVQQLIDILEHMRNRPGMYITLNRDALLAFLHGLSVGTIATQIKVANTAQDNIYTQILQSRGWVAGGAMHVSSQMEEQGYSIEKIIDETLLINIETLKRRYDIEARPNETHSG